MVEHPAVNRRVVGSNPTCGAKQQRLRVFSEPFYFMNESMLIFYYAVNYLA